ncbi:MAG: hypothetical protein ACI9Y1_002323 [Lentisphaeria bacterium]|jgi:hypothetical protein
MSNPLVKVMAVTILCCSALCAHAFELSPEQVNGVYQLAQPERSAAGQTQKLQIEYGVVNGEKVLVATSCPNCPRAGYRLLEIESSALNRPVFFNSSGIYIFAYDESTFVSVMGDAQLGKKVWNNITYANIYNKLGSAGIGLDEGKQFVMAESKRLMTGEGVAAIEVKGGNGTYYAAARQTVGSGSYDQIDVKIESKHKITLTGMNCRNCSSDTFDYQAELSDAIGKNVYEMGHMGRFLIEHDKGVLWWTNATLGKALWTDKNHFNVIAQDQVFVRQLTVEKELQSRIDQRLKGYATQAKEALDARYAQEDKQRTADNQLPKKGMHDQSLEQDALIAAKSWAQQYQWQETLRYVFIVDRDWGILRHSSTGIQTGRRIQGVVTMARDDGLCSYQVAIFEQAFNGSDYQKTVMTGVVPGQNKLDCAKL